VRASLTSLRAEDVLIEPQLGAFSAADFDHLPLAIPIGEAAARAAATRLAALSVSPGEYAQWREHQSRTMQAATDAVDEIRFRPMQRVDSQVLAATLETRANEAIDPDKLDRDMRRLFGTGDFEHVNYRILEESGRRVLDIDAVEKSWGPNYLRFGLGLGSDLKGDSFFNLAASYRRTWINPLGAEWRTDAQIGRTSRFATELYQPLETRHYLFVAPRAVIERDTIDIFEGSHPIASYDKRTAYVTLDLGSQFTKYGEARLGLRAGTIRSSLDTGPRILAPPGRVTQGAVTAQLIVDQLDNPNFPHSGLAGSAHLFDSIKALGADDSYLKWDADWLSAYSWGRHTWQLAAKAGGTLDNTSLPRYDLFQWGGFLQQSGYPTGALLGERLTFARAVYAYKLGQVKVLGSLYAGFSLEAGRMEKPLVPGSPTGTLTSMAAYFAVDSLLGPFYLGYGWSADGNRSAYLYLGRP
jgi:NTE family protein